MVKQSIAVGVRVGYVSEGVRDEVKVSEGPVRVRGAILGASNHQSVDLVRTRNVEVKEHIVEIIIPGGAATGENRVVGAFRCLNVATKDVLNRESVRESRAPLIQRASIVWRTCSSKGTDGWRKCRPGQW